MTTRQMPPRVRQLLQHIHQHLDQPLGLAELAGAVGCSRWQLQRDFGAVTGMGLAGYIRRLRLSRAAEGLLGSHQRQLDIALGCGFDSEISFTRAFRQQFGCSPGQYRRAGLRRGLCTPLLTPDDNTLLQLRIESRPAGRLFGISDVCHGLFADQPDCLEQIPRIWQQFSALGMSSLTSPTGVIQPDPHHAGRLKYWAGTLQPATEHCRLASLDIPAHDYLVLPHQRDAHRLARLLEWVIPHWLPESGYRYGGQFELETYQPRAAGYQMEYWIPVVPAPNG